MACGFSVIGSCRLVLSLALTVKTEARSRRASCALNGGGGGTLLADESISAPVTVETTADDHKADYPGATPIRIRIIGDRSTGDATCRRAAA